MAIVLAYLVHPVPSILPVERKARKSHRCPSEFESCRGRTLFHDHGLTLLVGRTFETSRKTTFTIEPPFSQTPV